MSNKMRLETGSRLIVASMTTNASTMPAPDRVGESKKKAEDARVAADEASAEQERLEAQANADDLHSQALDHTEKAMATKGNGERMRKAHSLAAMAHSDAANAYKKLSGGSSGNELETRSKAQKLSDAHTSMAEKHASFAKADTMSRNSTGTRGVVVDVQYSTPDLGTPLATLKLAHNAWSETMKDDAKKGVGKKACDLAGMSRTKSRRGNRNSGEMSKQD